MTTAAKNQSADINITRIYNAPVHLVWEAWTNPTQTTEWWGPRGFSITNISKDLKVGGHWNYTMHGPDGVDYPNLTKYYEVVRHARLVYDHGASDNTPPLFRLTVDFSEENAKTIMKMKMTLPTPEATQETRKFIKKAGGDATWDRLAEYLAKEINKKEIFVINRSFDTPIEKMYQMWTDPKLFSQWLPPTGFKMEFIKCDMKPGGEAFYVMTDGTTKMYGKTNYREFSPPHKIVYTQQFADENGNLARHPMSPTWPETMLTTVTLTEEGHHSIRVTVEWEIFGSATLEEIETFKNARAGMTLGWTGSFDKLENFISQNHKA